MKAVIVCEGKRMELAIGDTAVVGRNKAACDLVIDDRFNPVSRVHGQFELNEKGLFYRDLGSTNGSYVQMGRQPPKRVEPQKPVPLRGRGVVWLAQPNLVGVRFEVKSEYRTEKIGSVDIYDLFRRAKGLMKAGNYRAALEQLERILQLAPGAYDAYLDAAVCAASMGESERALELISPYLAVKPFDAEALEVAAEAASRCGRYREALTYLRRAATLSDPRRYKEKMREIEELAQISRGKSREIIEPDLKGYVESPSFRLEYVLSEHGRVHLEVVKALKLAQERCRELLGIEPSEPVQVILEPHPHPFRAGEKRGDKIVLYADDNLCDDVFFLHRLTIHEYVHHILTSHIDPDNLPWWLNEGLADRISEGSPERIERVDSCDILTESDFYKPAVHQTLKRAGLARSLVAKIEKKWGWQKIREILERLASGEDCRTVIVETIGNPVKLLNAEGEL